MTAQPLDVDIHAMTPEEFAILVRDSSDDQIRATFRAAPTTAALDRIFDIMQERFLPEKARNVTATVQWHITDDGEDHPYVIGLHDGHCETRSGTAQRPTTTITTDLARFARIAAGDANPIKLLMTRKLKASGDVNLGRRMAGFFDIPAP